MGMTEVTVDLFIYVTGFSIDQQEQWCRAEVLENSAFWAIVTGYWETDFHGEFLLFYFVYMHNIGSIFKNQYIFFTYFTVK